MSLILPVEGTPGVHDLIAGARSGATGYSAESRPPAAWRPTAPLTGRPMLVDFNEGAADVMAERSRRVGGACSFRSAKSSRATSSSSARRTRSCRTTSRTRACSSTFRPTVTDPGYDVVTENTLLRDRRRRRVGRAVVFGERIEVGRRSPGRFRCCSRRRCCRCRCSFASTRVSLPAGRHRARRRLRLLRRAIRAGATRTARSITGTVWIDRKTFARVRVQAVQGGLAGAGRLQRGDAALRAGRRSATARCSCSAD